MSPTKPETQIALGDAVVQTLPELSNIHGREVTSENVLYALIIRFGDEWEIRVPFDIWNKTMRPDDIVQGLTDFDFSAFDNEISVGFDVSDFMDRTAIYHRRVGIKWDNTTWRIHKYDADPFPSNPHAHQMDQNVRLDLSRGGLYKVKRKVGQLTRKELLEVRSRFELKGIEMPPLAI